MPRLIELRTDKLGTTMYRPLNLGGTIDRPATRSSRQLTRSAALGAMARHGRPCWHAFPTASSKPVGAKLSYFSRVCTDAGARSGRAEPARRAQPRLRTRLWDFRLGQPDLPLFGCPPTPVWIFKGARNYAVFGRTRASCFSRAAGSPPINAIRFAAEATCDTDSGRSITWRRFPGPYFHLTYAFSRLVSHTSV